MSTNITERIRAWGAGLGKRASEGFGRLRAMVSHRGHGDGNRHAGTP